MLVLPIQLLSLTTGGKSVRDVSDTASSEGDGQRIIHCCLIYSEDLKQKVWGNCRLDKAEYRRVNLLLFVYNINRRIM